MAKVLILCLSNSGHQAMARAIEAELQAADPSVRTVCLDPLLYAHPRLASFIHRTYLGVLKGTPELWDAMYDSPKLDRLTLRIRGLVQRGGDSASRKPTWTT